LVPHGYEVESVSGRMVRLKLPVIWEPERGAIIARASSTPSSANLDELRALIGDGLRGGDYVPGGELARWSR
jgi:hypothetical protein